MPPAALGWYTENRIVPFNRAKRHNEEDRLVLAVGRERAGALKSPNYQQDSPRWLSALQGVAQLFDPSQRHIVPVPRRVPLPAETEDESQPIDIDPFTELTDPETPPAPVVHVFTAPALPPARVQHRAHNRRTAPVRRAPHLAQRMQVDRPWNFGAGQAEARRNAAYRDSLKRHNTRAARVEIVAPRAPSHGWWF